MESAFAPAIDKLRNLVGLPWWGAFRSLNLHCLHFGKPIERSRRDGNLETVGEFALHIQCAWRLSQGDKIIVGSADRLTPRGPPSEIPDDFDCNQPRSTWCDQKLEELLFTHASEPLQVTAFTHQECGWFTLVCNMVANRGVSL
jgi:hypothetical protein